MKRLWLALILAAVMFASPSSARAVDPVPFAPFGPSTKANSYHPAGYDGTKDELHASGGVWIATKDDSPNIWAGRQETQDTATGFRDNTTIFRIGAVPIGKNGVPLLDFNHSDDEAANIAWRIHLDNDGNDLGSMYSEVWIQVVNNRDPSKVPFPVLKVSGKDGGSVTFEGRNSDGTSKVIVLAKAN